LELPILPFMATVW